MKEEEKGEKGKEIGGKKSVDNYILYPMISADLLHFFLQRVTI